VAKLLRLKSVVGD